MNCPECGVMDYLCRSRFEELLALEFTDASYGAVHHLTVATYMLQHSSNLTREGWLYERDRLREFLVENKPPSLIRAERKVALDSGERDFSIKSKDGRRVIMKSDWRRTIMDVHMETAEQYCEDVIAWARSALDESEKIAV